MTTSSGPDFAALPDAAAAVWLCAVDPAGLGGIVMRGRAGALRDRWVGFFQTLLAAGTPFRRLPLHADENRVFGGLDLSATLAAGRPVAARGVLAESDGGVVLLSMAERVPAATAARLGGVLDSQAVLLERDGLASRLPARLGLIALDEGLDPEEGLAPALLERLAFRIDLDSADPAAATGGDAAAVASARARYPAVGADDAVLSLLCGTTAMLGIDSARAALLALRAARAAAAFAGRTTVAEADAALAARLVLAPRATRLPATTEADPPPEGEQPPETAADQRPAPPTDPVEGAEEAPSTEAPDNLVLAAARAAIPPGLLERLQGAAAVRGGRSAPGRAGAMQVSTRRGRPAGVRRGMPTAGIRLNVIETLRAAAPWQRLRDRPGGTGGPRLAIRRDDLRITRFKQPAETTTVFVVDASGSLAANRLAEAKGAVELLLAECYVRRDQVALLAFRGRGAELLLPPTRSLARAKRCLAALPGGGPTPLAAAIDAALGLADMIRRRGQTPVVVFLTDGRANVARDGTTGRVPGDADAHQAARAAAASGTRMLLVDAAPRPQPTARALAASLCALYIPMPRAEAGALSRAVRNAS